MEGMKFYLTEITTYVDGTKDSLGIYTFNTMDEAVANFHSKMGGAMKNANYASELLIIHNSEGGHYDKYNEKYVRVKEKSAE